MEVDDAPDDGEAEAGAPAGRLGGVEGLEDFVERLRGDPAAAVLDRHRGHFVADVEMARLARAGVAMGLDDTLARGGDGHRTAAGHGVDGVVEEIHQHLLDAGAVEREAGQFREQPDADGDLVLGQAGSDAEQGIFDEDVEVLRLEREVLRVGEIEQAADDHIGPPRRLPHFFEHAGQHRIRAGRGALGDAVEAHEHDLERILQLVGDACRHASDGLHFLCLDELEVGGLQGLARLLQVVDGLLEGEFGALAFGDVGDEAVVAGDAVLLIGAEDEGVAHPALGAVFVDEAVLERHGPTREGLRRLMHHLLAVIIREHALREMGVVLHLLRGVAGDADAGFVMGDRGDPTVLDADGVEVIGDGIEQPFIAPFTLADGLFQRGAFDGVGDHAPEGLLVHGALDDVFLRPGAHGVEAERLAFVAGEEDDRRGGRVFGQAAEGGHAFAVGEGEIGEDDVEDSLLEHGEGFLHGAGDDDVQSCAGGRLVERLLEQQRVEFVVLHEQDARGRLGVRGHGGRCGAGWKWPDSA